MNPKKDIIVVILLTIKHYVTKNLIISLNEYCCYCGD